MTRNKSLPNKYNKLQQLVSKRSELLKSKEFSVALTDGIGVIITSGVIKEDREVLEEHAKRLRTDEKSLFLDSEIVSQPSKEEVDEIILDPEVVSLVFLGDGSFGTMHLHQKGPRLERITWDSLGAKSDHLKTGYIEQRTCTRILDPRKEVKVALGSLIIADQTMLMGTIDKSFANHNGYEVFNQHMTQLYERSNNTAEQLRRPIDYEL